MDVFKSSEDITIHKLLTNETTIFRHEKGEGKSMVETLKCFCRVALFVLAIFGVAESKKLGSGCAGNARSGPRFVKYRKRSIAIVSDKTGNVDKFSAIGVKIDALSTGIDDSMIYIFEGSEATPSPRIHVENNKTAASESHTAWSLELSCPHMQLNLKAKPLNAFGNGGGGEVPFIRMMSKIMKNEECPQKHSQNRTRVTAFGFILKQFLKDSPQKLELDDVDGALDTKSCSFRYKFLTDKNASTSSMCSLPKQYLSREVLDCSNQAGISQNPSALKTELSFAAAVAVHERTYISDELDSGHYLSEWTNDAHRSSFHNLNNLVDDRSFLQLKMEQHGSRKRRPSLFDAIAMKAMKRKK